MKTKINKLVLLVPLISMISGCNQSPGPQVLNVVVSGLAQPGEKTFFRTFVKLFQAEYGVTVNLTYENSTQLAARITQEQDSSVETDVIMVDTANMNSYIYKQQVEAINFIDDDYLDRTFTTFFDSYTHANSNRYFVPVSFDIYLTIYNRAALAYMPQEVEVMTDSNDTVTRITAITWQQIQDWANAIKTETGIAKFGFPYSSVSSQLMYPISGIAAAMGEYSMPNFVTTGSRKAWQYIADLQTTGALAHGPTFSSVNQPTELLNSNDLWISFGHMGPLGSAYQRDASKYVIGPAPRDQITNRAGSTAGAWAYGIVKGAPHQANAKKWLEFITDPEVNYLYCSGLGGVISPISEAITHLGLSPTDTVMASGLALFNDNVKILIVNTSGYQNWNEVKKLYTDLYGEVITGTNPDVSKLTQYQTSLELLANLT